MDYILPYWPNRSSNLHLKSPDMMNKKPKDYCFSVFAVKFSMQGSNTMSFFLLKFNSEEGIFFLLQPRLIWEGSFFPTPVSAAW